MAERKNKQSQTKPDDYTPSMPNVPSEWPGAFQLYNYSAQAVKRNVWLLLAIWAVYYAFNLLVSYAKLHHAASLIVSLLTGLLSIIFSVLSTSLLLAGIRGKHLTASEAFSGPLPMLTMKLIVLSLIEWVVLVGSLLALIVPFFIVLPRLSLATIFLIDKNLGPMEAYKASWHATRGHSSHIWKIFGVMLLFSLLLFTFIGIPLAAYLLFMYSAAFVVLYEMIDKNNNRTSNPTVSKASTTA